MQDSIEENISPVYQIRLFPPVGNGSKHIFDDRDDLCIFIKKMLDKFKESQLDTVEKLQAWKNDPVEFFANHLIITTIDPEKCPHYEFLFYG